MKSRKKHIYIIVTLFTLILAGAYGCQNGETDNSSSVNKVSGKTISELLTAIEMFEFKDKVPAVEFELENIAGGKSSLAQFRGKVIVLSFWTTW